MISSTQYSELVRLGTYCCAELKICATLYSRLGFYYDADTKKIICFSCALSLESSQLKSNCYNLHRQQSPECRFLNGHNLENIGLQIEPWINSNWKNEESTIWVLYQTVRARAETHGLRFNVPSNVEMIYHVEPAASCPNVETSAATEQPASTTESNPYNREVRVIDNEPIAYTTLSEESTSENPPMTGRICVLGTGSSMHSSNEERPVATTATPLPVATTATPLCIDRHNPDYNLLKRESARLSTYYDWPASAKKRPDELAAEGFFYVGMSDRVQCAFCKEHLRNWAAEDNIYYEHSRHFPKCSFVRGISDNIRNASGGSSWMMEDGPDDNSGVRRQAAAMPHSQSLSYDNQLSTSAAAFVLAHTSLSSTSSSSTIDDEKKRKNETEKGKCPAMNGVVIIRGSGAARQDKFVCQGLREGKKEPNAKLLEESRVLLEENRRLRDERTCKVCMDMEMNTVFLTCGHLICCEECAAGMKICPMCRNVIRGTVKTSTA